MRTSAKRTRLFLVELVLCLLIFVLSAAVCVGLLVHASGMSRESGTLTQAVYLAQTVAEEWKTGAVITVADGALTATVEATGEKADIAVWQGDRLIYSLEGVHRVE